MRFPDYNLYEEIGVSSGASDNEIKSAYRALAKQYHPDINNEKGAEERFKRISVAFDVLSDKQKRSRYDYGRSHAVSPEAEFNMYVEELLADINKFFLGILVDKYGANWKEVMVKKGLDPNNQLDLDQFIHSAITPWYMSISIGTLQKAVYALFALLIVINVAVVYYSG